MIIKDSKELGEPIKSKRKELGLTQKELAFAVNSGIRLIVGLERGERGVRIDKVIKICTMPGLKMDIMQAEYESRIFICFLNLSVKNSGMKLTSLLYF